MVPEWDELPEGLSEDLRAYIMAQGRQEMTERRAMLKFASVMCSCRPWYDREDPHPPQAGCMVHSTVLIGEKNWL